MHGGNLQLFTAHQSTAELLLICTISHMDHGYARGVVPKLRAWLSLLERMKSAQYLHSRFAFVQTQQ